MVRLTDHLNMTIVVDWDVKPQTKQRAIIIINVFPFPAIFHDLHVPRHYHLCDEFWDEDLT